MENEKKKSGIEDTTKKSLETGKAAVEIDKKIDKQQGNPKADENAKKDAEKWRNEG